MNTRPTAELRVAPPGQDAGRVIATASLTAPNGGSTDEIRYALDVSAEHMLTTSADPFVVAAVPLAMRRGYDLRVVGAPVSPSLLDSLERFQEVWHAWSGDPIVDVTAGDEEELDGPRPAAVSAFSGGVDSAYTVYRHTHGLTRRPRRLAAAVMIHGVDIPRVNRVGFVRAAARSRRMVSSVGLPLVTVETNLWEITGSRGYPIAAGLASVLHLLGAEFGTGLIPSTASYRQLLYPLGSTPVADVLLGSRRVGIVHDGSDAERFEKLEHLATWDVALRDLRVCLRDPHHHRNCGRCHKCVPVILSFRVLGVEAACFEFPPTEREILDWVPSLPNNAFQVRDARTILEHAEAAGLDDAWVRALRRKLRVVAAKDAARTVAPRWSGRAAAAHRWARARLRPDDARAGTP